MLDLHFPAYYDIPLWRALAEGLAWWVMLSVLLLVGGRLFSRSRFRSIDVFGTQTLARAPYLLVVLAGIAGGLGESPGVVSLTVVGAFTMLMLVWMVWLMFKGFSHSCNLGGAKAAAIFVACLLIAEIGSKALLAAVPPAGAQGPPEVIETVPANGAADVDSSLGEIRVTFSREMLDKSWSWCLEDRESFPRTNGEPYYETGNTTAVLPVSLEPGKEYVLWINREKYNNFQDTGGNRAKDYRLSFSTAGEKGSAAVKPGSAEQSGRAAKARQLLGSLEEEDYAAAVGLFDKNMKKQLPEGKLEEVWESVQARAGSFDRELEVRMAREQGYEIAYVKCAFENANVIMKAVFDREGKVAGLFFLPAD